jgi:hypothetical protein
VLHNIFGDSIGLTMHHFSVEQASTTLKKHTKENAILRILRHDSFAVSKSISVFYLRSSTTTDVIN